MERRLVGPVKLWGTATFLDRVVRRFHSAYCQLRAGAAGATPLSIQVPRSVGPRFDFPPYVSRCAEPSPDRGAFVLASRNGEAIEFNLVDNAVLCLTHHRCEYLRIVCRGLNRGRDGGEFFLIPGPLWHSLQAGTQTLSPEAGYTIRLRRTGSPRQIPSFSLGPNFAERSANVSKRSVSRKLAGGPTPRQPPLEFRSERVGDRPTVLVLPALLAVGGVERNLIEILRELTPTYRFVVATTEPVDEEFESLHHQLGGLSDAVFELGRVGSSSNHLRYLQSIKEIYRPELVWICNGSPWLVAHARELRALFRSVPIIDQQVYDDKEGWIRFFARGRFRDFDRFVAINKKIRRAFLEEYHLPEDRVDLIQHGIDSTRFSVDAARRLRGRLDSSVPSKIRTFLFVGRLCEQKRPLRFLDLARRSALRGLQDEFLLVGDGELADVCDAYIKNHDLRRVRRRRYVEELEPLYAGADGLIVTSAYEGLPICLLEALSMGVPVFASDVGEIGDVLAGFRIGTTVPVDAATSEIFDAFLSWRDELPHTRVTSELIAGDVGNTYSAARAARCYDACWQRARAERAMAANAGGR